MDYREAEFVRFVAADEVIAALVDEAKGETWTRGQEFALLVIAEGRRSLVAGGRDGIEFRIDSDGRPVVTIDDVDHEVAELVWHTHPRATGPSDFDYELLRILHQDFSVVHEITGVPGCTLFRRKR